jgi:transposase InsO family protein
MAGVCSRTVRKWVDRMHDDAPKLENSLFCSLLAENLDAETGSITTASATTHSSNRAISRRPRRTPHLPDFRLAFRSPRRQISAWRTIWRFCLWVRSGNVWDNAAMESFFSSLLTEWAARNCTEQGIRPDVFDYIERFSNPKQRHSAIGYMSPMELERQAA